MAFSALSQDIRLDAFRLLINAGDKGLLSGEIGLQLGQKPNTISTNLSILLNAELIRNRREGRAVRYFADFEGIRAMLGFLMEDCCGGEPALCQKVIDEVTCVA